jgi:hypothetical protein
MRAGDAGAWREARSSWSTSLQAGAGAHGWPLSLPAPDGSEKPACVRVCGPAPGLRDATRDSGARRRRKNCVRANLQAGAGLAGCLRATPAPGGGEKLAPAGDCRPAEGCRNERREIVGRRKAAETRGGRLSAGGRLQKRAAGDSELAEGCRNERREIRSWRKVAETRGGRFGAGGRLQKREAGDSEPAEGPRREGWESSR